MVKPSYYSNYWNTGGVSITYKFDKVYTNIWIPNLVFIYKSEVNFLFFCKEVLSYIKPFIKMYFRDSIEGSYWRFIIGTELLYFDTKQELVK